MVPRKHKTRIPTRNNRQSPLLHSRSERSCAGTGVLWAGREIRDDLADMYVSRILWTLLHYYFPLTPPDANMFFDSRETMALRRLTIARQPPTLHPRQPHVDAYILLENVERLRPNGAGIRDRHAQDTRLRQPSDERHMGQNGAASFAL